MVAGVTDRGEADFSAMEEYIGRCRAAIIELTGELPAEDLSWAMHLVDHGEAPEGICALAWSLAEAEHPGMARLAPGLQDLMAGMIPEDALPAPFRSDS